MKAILVGTLSGPNYALVDSLENHRVERGLWACVSRSSNHSGTPWHTVTGWTHQESVAKMTLTLPWTPGQCIHSKACTPRLKPELGSPSLYRSSCSICLL